MIGIFTICKVLQRNAARSRSDTQRGFAWGSDIPSDSLDVVFKNVTICGFSKACTVFFGAGIGDMRGEADFPARYDRRGP